MCLTDVLSWKPTETSFGLDQNDFYETSLKMVKNLQFFETCFSRIKWRSYVLFM